MFLTHLNQPGVSFCIILCLFHSEKCHAHCGAFILKAVKSTRKFCSWFKKYSRCVTMRLMMSTTQKIRKETGLFQELKNSSSRLKQATSANQRTKHLYFFMSFAANSQWSQKISRASHPTEDWKKRPQHRKTTGLGNKRKHLNRNHSSPVKPCDMNLKSHSHTTCVSALFLDAQLLWRNCSRALMKSVC